MGAIAALALAPLALTGCTGASSSAAAPTPMASTASASSTPVETPKSTPPAIPEAAKAPTRQGAEAFAAYFFDVVNYLAQSGDGDALRQISEPECSLCANTAASADKARQSHSQVRGGVITVIDAGAPGGGGDRPRMVAVDVLVSREAGVVAASDGSPIASNPADPRTVFTVTVNREVDGWRVASVKAVS